MSNEFTTISVKKGLATKLKIGAATRSVKIWEYVDKLLNDGLKKEASK